MATDTNPTELEAALGRLEDLFDVGDLDLALELTEALASRFPHEPQVLRFRAAALAGDGRLDEACEILRDALARDPDDLETLHAAIELLVHDLDGDHDAYEEALGLLKRAKKLARKAGDEEHLIELHLLTGVALGGLGDSRGALEAVEEAARLDPDDPEVAVERGIALFELCRLGEAKAELERALEAEPGHAAAHHYLGLVAEHLGQPEPAARHLRRARQLAPDDFAAPVAMSADAFAGAVEAALERLPERVRRYLGNVAILVEELPDLEEMRAAEPPLSPGSLGLFRGTPYTEQSTADPWSHLPSAIVLFRSNLRRFARSPEELVEQIGITLVHEVGHFLGLSEEDLYERGLD